MWVHPSTLVTLSPDLVDGALARPYIPDEQPRRVLTRFHRENITFLFFLLTSPFYCFATRHRTGCLGRRWSLQVFGALYTFLSVFGMRQFGGGRLLLHGFLSRSPSCWHRRRSRHCGFPVFGSLFLFVFGVSAVLVVCVE